jgi:hypothetical protein
MVIQQKSIKFGATNKNPKGRDIASSLWGFFGYDVQAKSFN